MFKLTKQLYCMYLFVFQKKSSILHPLSNMVNLSLKFILRYILAKTYCFNYVIETVFKLSEKFILSFYTIGSSFATVHVHMVYQKIE